MSIRHVCGAAILMALGLPHSASAFETSTHWQLSVATFEQSILKDPGLHRRLGIEKIIDQEIFKPTQKKSAKELLAVFPTCDPRVLMKLRQLLTCGAMFEDIPGTRSLNHFFDPINGAPLTLREASPSPKIGGYPTLTSPDWALQDSNENVAQQFSLRNARQHFLTALTAEGPASNNNGRNQHWAMLFQTLGHVIHHVQDMAQPQHTRNDAHSDWWSPLLGSVSLGTYRHPSRYEKYSMGRIGVAKIESAISKAMPAVYPKYANLVSSPREFWISKGYGLSEYSNGNFVSSGRNFLADIHGVLTANEKYMSPAPSGSQAVSLAVAFGADPIHPSVIKLCEDVGVEYCEMTFYSNGWTDALTSSPAVNWRASTASIFDEDLIGRPFTYSWENAQVTTTRIYALNQLNFDATYPFLIPRAVAYSAGLINYFFRGQMEIGLPSAGIYSVVDHHSQGCKHVCGFRRIQLRVRNTTPGENMSEGTLRAVAKFHRNNCYREDLGGDPGGPAFASISCRSAEEEAFVSNPLPVATLATLEERELTFTFPNAIPINATDVFLQVVFQGKLGEEPDAVAVATRDISEPNYFAFTNVTDKAYDFGDHAFHALPFRTFSSPDSVYGVSVAFRDGAAPLAQIAQLDAANHAQLAYLTDSGRQFLDIRYSSHRYTVGSPIRGTVPVSEFVGDATLGTYGRNVIFSPSRGMYRNYFEYHRLPVDFTVYDCRVEVELCTQSTMTPFTPASAVEWTINF